MPYTLVGHALWFSAGHAIYFKRAYASFDAVIRMQENPPRQKKAVLSCTYMYSGMLSSDPSITRLADHLTVLRARGVKATSCLGR